MTSAITPFVSMNPFTVREQSGLEKTLRRTEQPSQLARQDELRSRRHFSKRDGLVFHSKNNGRLAEQFRVLRRAAGRVTEWKPPYWTLEAIEGTCLACDPSPNLADLGISDGTTQH
jgi:hypothetical protein